MTPRRYSHLVTLHGGQNLVDRYSCVGVGMGMIGGTVVCGLSLSGLIGGAGLGAAAAIGVVIAKNKTASQK